MIKGILNLFFIVGSIVLSRKILKLILYFVYLIIIVLVLIYFFFYAPFIKKIKPSNGFYLSAPANVSISTVEQVSWFFLDKKSSFNNFSFEKEEGVIRIGAFGDSHTHGDEVDFDSDYPSILQELFLRDGYSNVEVLNFGVGGWGNFSSFRLWELEGRKYNLDFVLFGPKGFWDVRDLTFNWKDESSDNIHGRYILKKDGIEYVKPLGGADIAKRFDLYHSFIPKSRYFIYDKRPPAIIRSILSENKTIDNPFYYYDGELKNEYSEIYNFLFQKIAKESKQIITINESGNNFVPDFDKVPFSSIDNFYYSDAFELNNSLFDGMNGHAGPLHNNLLAQEYFNVLTGKNEQSLNFINISSYRDKYNFLTTSTVTEINEVNNITVDFDENIVGVLISNINNKLQRSGDFTFLKPIDFYRNKNIKSFICIKTKYKKIEESLFLPLDFEVNPEMELILKPLNKSETHNRNFGKISLITKNIAYIESDSFFNNGVRVFEDRRYINGMLSVNTKENLNDFSLFLEENKIYTVKKKEIFGKDEMMLYPEKFNHLIFRTEIAYPQFLNSYNDKGTMYLTLRKNENVLDRITIGEWRKESKEYLINKTNQRYYIKKDNVNGIGMIVENK